MAKTNTSVEARQGVALQREGISIENNAIHHGKEEGNWSALFDWLIDILLFWDTTVQRLLGIIGVLLIAPLKPLNSASGPSLRDQ